MECDLLALVEEDGFRSVRKSMSRGGQYNGPCPWCGGTDRFRVQPHQGSYGWFACSQCGHKGSAVDYLIQKRGLSKQEALVAVGWTPKDGSTPQMILPRHVNEPRSQWEAPPEQWQEAAGAFAHECQRLLYSSQGQEALAYLRRRGLSDATIKKACLGYHPAATYGRPSDWGQRVVKLPQGIVFPWFVQGHVWRVTVRNAQIKTGPGRYIQLAGGSNGLYLADALQLHRAAVVLVEGELDALSLAQTCGDLVAVVATGTTQGSHPPKWVSLLARQARVLVAFDAEESGDKAAQWWMERLPHAERLRPWWKDANQMLQDGADLRAWIEPFVAGSGVPASPPVEHVKPSFLDIAHTKTSPTPEKPRPLRCLFENVVEVGKERCLKAVPCSKPATANGWCEAHQHAQALLDLGEQLDYPRLHLDAVVNMSEGRWHWELTARRSSAKRVSLILQKCGRTQAHASQKESA